MSKTQTMAAAVKSSVKEVAQELGLRVSGEFYEALDGKVTEIINLAAIRAKGNGRQTLQTHDL